MAGRGRYVLEVVEKRLQEERLDVWLTTRCGECGGEWEGPLRDNKAAFAAHRLECSPHMRQRTNHHRRVHGQMVISPKTVEDNVAGVREQGGHSWDEAA